MEPTNSNYDQQVALIDRLYHLYDALSTFSSLDDFPDDLRLAVVNNLRAELEHVKSCLAFIEGDSKGGANKLDDNLLIPARIYAS